MSLLENYIAEPCTAPCTLTLPRLSCIDSGHCGTPRRSVLRIQPPTLQIPVRHHLRTLRWCDCKGGGLVASISTITTTITTPPCAVSPPVTWAARSPNLDTPGQTIIICRQVSQESHHQHSVLGTSMSKLENPSAQCAAECLNPPAVVGECECTAPAPPPPPLLSAVA